MARGGYVYILTNRPYGTLYVGVTSDLIKRIYQHRTGQTGGFTARYGLTRLVYYEAHAEMAAAILREKRIKRWQRAWKIELIESANPDWRDLWPEITGDRGNQRDPG